MILKGASGLGDSIYAYPIVKHYCEKHDDITVMSNYPELFADLPVKVIRHTKDNSDIRFTYGIRKYTPGTNQFQDSVISAKIKEDLKLEIPWSIKNDKMIARINKLFRRSGKKFKCALAVPYKPFGRTDDFGKEMTVNYKIIDELIKKFKDNVFFIQVGRFKPLYRYNNLDVDMNFKTTIPDLMDIVTYCDIGITQVGNLLPICECRNTPVLAFFSENGFKSESKFVRAITPGKTLCKISSVAAIDTEPQDTINERFGKML